MKYIIILAMTLFPFALLAQNNTIKGRTVETETNKPVRDALIHLISLPDSAAITHTSRQGGTFSFENVKQGKYLIRVTHVGYMQFERVFEYDGKPFDMGNIFLLPKSTMTDEVTVVGQSVTAELIGDTTQFNASAFKTTQDASAEDLVRKMPGVVVDGGQTRAQGETVREVLVDGRPFMGDDPTAALRNLPAEMIDKIQVFDRRSDQSAFTGIDDGQTSKTLNIITRADMRNASFGKLYAGYGTDERYNAGGIVNFFSGDSRFSVLFQSNNLNNQNFAAEDLLGVLGASARRNVPAGIRGPGGRGPGAGSGIWSMMRGGTDVSDFMVSQQSGIVTTNAFGLNYSDNWASNLEVTGSYFLNYTENDRREETIREFILDSPISQTSEEFLLSSSNNWNHRLNMRIRYNIDSSNYMIMRPRLSFQSNDGNSNTLTSQFLDGTPSNNTTTDFNSELKGISFTNDLFYGHRFEKQGRNFSINLTTAYNENTGNNKQNTFYMRRFQDDIQSDSLMQFGDLDKNGYRLGGEILYTEPIIEDFYLNISYAGTLQRDKSDKFTYQYDPDILLPPRKVESLSSQFESDLFMNRAGASLRYQTSDISAVIGLFNEWNTLENITRFPNQFDEKRTFSNFTPRLHFRYAFSKESNIRMFYRNSLSLPSIDQLQVAVNNSNPMNLTTGNPNLNEDSRHDIMIRYSNVNQANSDMFFAMVAFGTSDNYISRNTLIALKDTLLPGDIFLPLGGQFSNPINIDGYQTFRSFISYGKYVGLIRSNVNLTGSFDWSEIPSIINANRNIAESKNISLNAVISSNISTELDFTLSTTSMLNYVTNSLTRELNSDYFIQKTSVRLNWVFLGGFVFETNFEHQYYQGLSAAIKPNVYLWNLSIGRKFLQDNRAEIKLMVYDVMKQNNAITRNITESYIDDVRSNVLQKYFLLNFTYNLRIFNI